MYMFTRKCMLELSRHRCSKLGQLDI